MEPSVGRIVHFNLEGGGIAPAIIIAVHSGECLSLNVFTFAGPVVKTSVVVGVENEAGKWFWPNRT